MEADEFLTIASESQGLYREKGSKFLSFAYPVNSEEEVKEKVDFLRKKYFDARHHCYAYRLGVYGERFRTIDDGEPANSAGKPILGQLTSCGVTNVLVVVVRYFGGILLGVGGLVQAYKQAAADALANAKIVTEAVTETHQLTFGYQYMNQVMKIVKDMNLEWRKQDDNMNGELNCTIYVKVKKSFVEQLLSKFSHIMVMPDVVS